MYQKVAKNIKIFQLGEYILLYLISTASLQYFLVFFIVSVCFSTTPIKIQFSGIIRTPEGRMNTQEVGLVTISKTTELYRI